MGMGKELFKISTCREIFRIAGRSRSGYGKLFFRAMKGAEQTENTQPAILTTSTPENNRGKRVNGCYSRFKFGEYFLSLFRCARFYISGRTGQETGNMQEAVPLGVGKMLAILGLTDDKVENMSGGKPGGNS